MKTKSRRAGYFGAKCVQEMPLQIAGTFSESKQPPLEIAGAVSDAKIGTFRLRGRFRLRGVLLRALVRGRDELVLLDDADERVRGGGGVRRRADLVRDVHAADDGRDEPLRGLPERRGGVAALGGLAPRPLVRPARIEAVNLVVRRAHRVQPRQFVEGRYRLVANQALMHKNRLLMHKE